MVDIYSTGECYCRLAPDVHPPSEACVVDCDANCDALQHPVSLEEYRDALKHWRYHRYLSGCSHAC